MEKSEIKGFIAKRCAKELKDGDVVNLGIGLPTLIPNYLPEGVEVIIHAELGIVSAGVSPKEGDANYDPYHVVDAGGTPSSVAYGGGFIDSATNFGLIRGGHVDATVLGGLEVDDETEVIYGNVLQIGDAAFAYYGFSQYGSDRHVKLVNSCAEMLEQYDAKLYDILIPTSVGVVVSSEYMEKLKCTDQGQTISYIFSQESDKVQKVNVFNTLIEHNDEYLYFRTDHHWTALGAYYSYEQFCAVAGFEPVPLEDFEELDMGPFLGSFYGSCSQSSKLREDNVLAYDPPGDISMTITKDNGSSFPWPVLTDMSKSSIYSKYMTFLGGDHPLVTITNNDLPDGPNCVVIKDSFGNPFAPYLSQHYHNVYVIDYRKYSEMTLSYFVQYYDIDDVLLTESLAMAQGSGTLDLLEWFCK